MLANQIMILRKASRMSQSQLAKKLNIGPSAVGMYEQGRRMPIVDALIEILNLFEVSLDYLIIGREISNLGKDKANVAVQSVCPCRTCCSRCNKCI